MGSPLSAIAYHLELCGSAVAAAQDRIRRSRAFDGDMPAFRRSTEECLADSQALLRRIDGVDAGDVLVHATGGAGREKA